MDEEDDFALANIKEILDGFVEGTARLVQKSAPLPDPEQEKDKIVKTIVFDNFYATVNQSEHDSVIIMVSKRKSTHLNYFFLRNQILIYYFSRALH